MGWNPFSKIRPTGPDAWDEELTDERYGLGHYQRPGPGALPGVLAVFVHGFMGDSRTTFRDLPKWLRDKLAADFDAVSYVYPSAPWVKADIVDAAEQLRGWLGVTARHHRHLIFITHSTGALVVKEALCREPLAGGERLPPRASAAPHAPQRFDPPARLDFSRSPGQLMARTRLILNLSPAHGGASPLATTGLRAGAILNSLMETSRVGRWWPFAGGAIGRNELIRQLRLGSPYVDELEGEYNERIRLLDEQSLARPVSVDVLADADQIVQRKTYHSESWDPSAAAHPAIGSRRDVSVIEARGTHTQFKIPKKPGNYIVELSADLIRPWVAPAPQGPGGAGEAGATSQTLTLADRTVLRCEYVDGLEGEDKLLGGAGSRAASVSHAPPLGDVAAFSQEALLARLLGHARGSQMRPRRIVVTGGPGMGKSLVLRRLAKQLALDCLKGKAGPIPVLIPLQQVPLSPSPAAGPAAGPSAAGDPISRFCNLHEPSAAPLEDRWGQVRDYWVAWSNKLAEEQIARVADPGDEAGSGLKTGQAPSGPPLAAGWLDAQLARRRVVLMIDGLDDFVANHERVEFVHIQRMIDELGAALSGNASLSIIMGVRSREADLADLASARDDVMELRPPTADEAEVVFPGTRVLLAKLPEPKQGDGDGDAGLRGLLLSPFFLRVLAPRADDVKTEHLKSEMLMTRRTAELLAERLRDNAPAGAPGDRIRDPDRWIDAAMLVAWDFTRRFAAELGEAQIVKHCRESRQSWEEQLAAAGQGQSRAAAEIREAFDLVIEDEDARKVLLNQTVLFSTGRGMYRFRHRNWEEYLVARYLARAIALGNLAELLPRAFNLPIYRFAGEILERGGVSISASTVAALQTFTREVRQQAVLGNFTAIVGNSRVQIEDPAVGPLLAQMDGYFPTARFVALNSYSSRATGGGDDPLAARLRGRLPEVYRRYAADPSLNRLIRSLAWCQHAVGHRLWPGVVDAPTGPWPDLGAREADEADAIALSRTPVENPQVAHLLHRSAQTGFLRYAEAALHDGRHLTTAAHYLFALAAAFRHEQLLDLQIRKRLPELLAEGSPLRLMASREDTLAEVRTILDVSARFVL